MDSQFLVARKHLIWAVPLFLVGLVVLFGLLALPAFVSAPAHRKTVEGFASQLTGRRVHISGNLSLSYLPRPEITATGITITGPDHEIITARALSLDISLTSLLRGQFGAQTLRLESPLISFPWPIPGGINDIAPAPWLATLHAQISNGQIKIGAIQFTSVNADLLTGAGGRVHMAGTGNLDQQPVTLDLSIGQTASIGGTPVVAHAEFAGIKANLDGSLDTSSLLTGQLALQMPNEATSQMQIHLNASGLNIDAIKFQQGQAVLNGSAQLAFKPLLLSATLFGQNLDANSLLGLNKLRPQSLPIQANFNVSDITLAGEHFPSLKADFIADGKSESLQNIVLDAPGATSLKGNLFLAHSGTLAGQLTLSASDFNGLLAAFGLPANNNWDTATLHATVQGTRQTPQLADISGVIGHDHVEGQIFLSAHHAGFALHFDHLVFESLAKTLQPMLTDSSFTADGELSVAEAKLGPVSLSNLFVDASLHNGLNIRRVTANLYGGMGGGNIVLDNHLNITSAHVFLNLPLAAPVVTALAPTLKLPRAFLNQPLSLIAAASGTPDALAVSSVVNLGAFTFTISPLVDLTKLSAQGAVSLRAPDAIAAFKTIGLINGCSRMAPLPGFPFKAANQPCVATATNAGLAFPGPGSLSLRAHFTAAPDNYALTDFILSTGLLNASGRLSLHKDQLSGQITATTLPLPALAIGTVIPSQLPISGQINLSAAQIVYAGDSIFGPSSAALTVAPNEASLSKLTATLGNGTITGNVDVKLSPAAPPALSATLAVKDVDASALNLQQPFPLSLPTGQIDATSTLKASGYTLRTWASTLSGNVTLTMKNGSLEGLSLPNITTALVSSKPSTSSSWMTQGNTPFTTLSIAATIFQGNCTLTQAQLSGPAGSVSALGGIDLFDRSLALRLEAIPALQPPVTLTTKLIGPWAHPSRVTDTSAALTWHAARSPR